MARNWPATVVLSVSLLMSLAAPVAAYNPANAANYADAWWSTYNAAWPSFHNDCTNFVSQSAYAGGIPMSYVQNNPWYAYADYIGWHTSQSWSIVQYNHGFFPMAGHGTVVNVYSGVKTAPTSGARGDFVYYAWYGDRTFATDSHESIITVTSGTATSTPDVGALVDAHTNSRYHEYWTLYKWNYNWPTTYYEVMHIY